MSRSVTRYLASANPRPPPRNATRIDSASTSTRTNASENPTAFSTASSPVRSRTAMAMVFPVTSRRVKKTTVPMARIRKLMFPICLTNPAAKAFSVWVRVSQGEFANASSMAFATATPSLPFARRVTYQPTRPLFHSGPFSSKYFRWNQNCVVSSPGRSPV